jgi:hypothetical protein
MVGDSASLCVKDPRCMGMLLGNKRVIPRGHCTFEEAMVDIDIGLHEYRSILPADIGKASPSACILSAGMVVGSRRLPFQCQGMVNRDLPRPLCAASTSATER